MSRVFGIKLSGFRNEAKGILISQSELVGILSASPGEGGVAIVFWLLQYYCRSQLDLHYFEINNHEVWNAINVKKHSKSTP